MKNEIIKALLLGISLVLATSLNAYEEEGHGQLIAFMVDQKILDSAGSPVREAQENWRSARLLVSTDPAWRSWLASVRRPVDLWMQTTKDRADWIAGDMHELLDPVSKAPLTWSLKLGMPEGTDESSRKSRQAWIAWFRNQNFYMIQEAARIHALTGDSQYGDWAQEQLDFYADHYADWPLRNVAGLSRMMGQGLDEATACVPLLDAVRLLKGTAPASKFRNWGEKLFRPMARQLLASGHADNIRLWQTVAVTMIGMQFDDERLVDEGLNGERGIRALVRKGVTADYFWYEGSLGYQAYVLRALGPLFVYASLSGRSKELTREMLIAQNMLLSPLLIRFEDGMLPTPGDSRARLRAIDPGLYIEYYRTLPSRISLKEASSRRNWQTLVDPVKLVSSDISLPEVTSRNFESIRMAVLRKSGWQIFFRYGQLVKNHSQQDALSTEIYFEGTPVSVVPSTVLYGAPLHEQYLGRGASRNSMLVDGEGQFGVGVGVVDAFDPSGSSMTARQPKFTSDAEATRRLEVSDGAIEEESRISLRRRGDRPRRLGFLFHTDCEVDVSASPFVTEIPAPKGTGFPYWSGVRAQTGTLSSRLSLFCSDKMFEIQFDLSEKGSIYFGRTPTKPLPKLRNSFYIEIVSTEAVLRTRLRPVHRIL